jgi:drug/metabolite transporter (DMT)-like permease
MDRKRYIPFAALAAAGLLWGLTVPLSKLAMGWLEPTWLTAARFAVSAPLLAIIGRRSLREALRLRVAVAGAIGFGGVIMLQNAGIERTSVSHAAVIVGMVPVLVALVAVALGQSRVRPRTWGGSGLALGGIALVAGAGSGNPLSLGDLFVLASAVLSAGFIATQPRLLEGRAPAAVTAVQFAAGGLVALPIAAVTGGAPSAPAHAGAVAAYVALALVGTLLPFWLFAFGQARVTADVAGAFVNLEPLVGAAVGWLAFGDAAAPQQIAGAFAVLAGIVVSTLPRRDDRVGRQRGHPGRRRRGHPGCRRRGLGCRRRGQPGCRRRGLGRRRRGQPSTARSAGL